MKGFIFIPLLVVTAFVAWTSGWIWGQKRICDQGRGCVWKTGTVIDSFIREKK
jgi:hypothetical protein